MPRGALRAGEAGGEKQGAGVGAVPEDLVERAAGEGAVGEEVVEGGEAGGDGAVAGGGGAAEVGGVDLQELTGMAREELHRRRVVCRARWQERTAAGSLVSTHFRSGPTSDYRL